MDIHGMSKLDILHAIIARDQATKRISQSLSAEPTVGGNGDCDASLKSTVPAITSNSSCQDLPKRTFSQEVRLVLGTSDPDGIINKVFCWTHKKTNSIYFPGGQVSLTEWNKGMSHLSSYPGHFVVPLFHGLSMERKLFRLFLLAAA